MAAPTFTGNVNNVVLPSPKDLPSVGGIYVGPLSAAVPDAAFTIDALMNHLGFIGSDGFDDKEDRSVKAIYDWGGDTIAKPQENYGKTATFTMLEFLKPEVAKFAYKASNVTATAATSTHGNQLSIKVTSDTLDMQTILVDTFSPGGKRVMQFYPLGRIESKDTMKWARTDVLAHRVTVSFLPDTTGAYCYIRTDDGLLSA
ncbi:hypothetical protein [Mycobacterium sp. E1747]|uniref:hypothetical protein n=1 Tax=Mycobacterium sp. E1747 TaxID=1834128 RepID=UPI00080165C0|nr:hypothetical protein [Mycobacterium sp. E1747]OBH07934.1 hypothetical protein A5695_26970 [Mycobacterium sp. E1747]